MLARLPKLLARLNGSTGVAGEVDGEHSHTLDFGSKLLAGEVERGPKLPARLTGSAEVAGEVDRERRSCWRG